MLERFALSIQGLATCAGRRAMSHQNYETKLKAFALHQAKATATLSDQLISELRAGPPSSLLTKVEDLEHQLATALHKEKEQEATISKLTLENKVVYARCATYEKQEEQEKQLVALQAENKIVNQQYAGARAAGHAEGLAKILPTLKKDRLFFKNSGD